MFNFRVLIGRPSNELRCIGRRPFDVLTSVHVARTQVTTHRCSAWPATACWRVSLAWRPAAAWSKSFPPSLGCSSAHHYHGQWLSQAISRLRRFAKWMRGGAEGWGWGVGVVCVSRDSFSDKKKKNKIFFYQTRFRHSHKSRHASCSKSKYFLLRNKFDWKRDDGKKMASDKKKQNKTKIFRVCYFITSVIPAIHSAGFENIRLAWWCHLPSSASLPGCFPIRSNEHNNQLFISAEPAWAEKGWKKKQTQKTTKLDEKVLSRVNFVPAWLWINRVYP